MPKDTIVKSSGKKSKGVFVMKNFRKGKLIFRDKKSAVVRKKAIPKLPRAGKKRLN